MYISTIKQAENMTNEINFIDNDYSIAVCELIMEGMSVEEAKAKVLIEAEIESSKKQGELYKQGNYDKAEMYAAREEWAEIRKQIVAEFPKEHVSAYIVASKKDKFKALTTGYILHVPNWKRKQ